MTGTGINLDPLIWQLNGPLGAAQAETETEQEPRHPWHEEAIEERDPEFMLPVASESATTIESARQ